MVCIPPVNFAPTVVNLVGFKVNLIDRASKISFGGVVDIDFFLSTKINQGYGESAGDFNVQIFPISTVYDPDVIDSPSSKVSVI
ncbi:hypothetical protein [Longirhabdus pacifica]|uniref:hypothetical protein n=1 Tax=Longirhabdus pacifica TaxID=2305227 RepID=UPI001008C151|nr:hypothetical protein [Longirhabdus pacifica]